jgi:MOSC domain-containing protein YiiM
MQSVESLQLVAEAGIAGEPRYFGRKNASGDQPSRRQLSLIEREQISAHAATLGLVSIPPGVVRSNIETLGIELVAWIGCEVQVGEARVRFHSPRTPCQQMDAICPGLRALMENGRQGVMAEVTRSGIVRLGDPVQVVSGTSPSPS